MARLKHIQCYRQLWLEVYFTTKVRFVLFITLMGAIPFQSGWAFNVDSAHYIEVYGRATPSQTSYLQQAEEVFARLSRIVEHNMALVPKLVVINSDATPWAIAIPDNHIVLSKGALALCYNNVSPQLGDARLAFILGHELAHFNHQDFWQHDIVRHLIGGSEMSTELTTQILGRTNVGEISHQEARNIELQADDAGFLYAILAGFPVHEALNTNQQSFFDFWIDQTHTTGDITHYAPGFRQQFLQARLNELAEHAELAQFAFALSALSSHVDAIAVYESVSTFLPTKEIYNNLAYSILQKALLESSSIHNKNFVFPAGLDQSQLQLLAKKSLFITDRNKAKEQLLLAKVYLQKALHIEPNYLTGLMNQATVLAYLEEWHAAREVIERAIKLAPQSWAAQMMRDIILFQQEKDIDIWSIIVTRLNVLLDSWPDNSLIKFNLGVLYERRDQLKRANELFSSIQNNSNISPVLISAICFRTNQSDCRLHPTSAQINFINVADKAQALIDFKESTQLKTLAHGRPKLVTTGALTGLFMDDNLIIFRFFSRLPKFNPCQRPTQNQQTGLSWVEYHCSNSTFLKQSFPEEDMVWALF